jgi:hypothetical protein
MPGKYRQRNGKKRPRKVGDIKALQRMFWQALLEAEYILMTAEDTETSLKAIHAIAQAGGGYAKLLEATDMDARLQKVEASVIGLASRNGHVAARMN